MSGGTPYTGGQAALRQCVYSGFKAGQTKFAVYRHRPHGFSDFPKKFQISDTVNVRYFKPHPSIALIGGRDLGDIELEH